MGSYVTIIIADPGRPMKEHRAAARAAFEEIKRLENTLSRFSKNNIVAKINSAGTKEMPVDSDTFYVLEQALYFNRISNGAFDITAPRPGRIALDPAKKTIKFLAEGTKIDLGGIAVGYAVDRAISVLKANGVKNAIVDAGGDIYCLGKRPDGKKWQIGIRDPFRKNRVVKTLEIEDAAVSTSGNYEKRGHIIDPATSRPVENNLVGVTMVAKDCITADALATAVFVLGKDEGEKLARGLNGVSIAYVSISKS